MPDRTIPHTDSNVRVRHITLHHISPRDNTTYITLHRNTPHHDTYACAHNRMARHTTSHHITSEHSTSQQSTAQHSTHILVVPNSLRFTLEICRLLSLLSCFVLLVFCQLLHAQKCMGYVYLQLVPATYFKCEPQAVRYNKYMCAVLCCALL